MSALIGVSGLRKITSSMVDDAMDLLRRSRKNLLEGDGSEGASSYSGRWKMKGVATLDKEKDIGIVVRVAAPIPISGVPLDVDVSPDIGVVSKSTGDAEVEFEVIVTAQMQEIKPKEAPNG